MGICNLVKIQTDIINGLNLDFVYNCRIKTVTTMQMQTLLENGLGLHLFLCRQNQFSAYYL